MRRASSVFSPSKPNINIIDVSGFGNNCGLYALTLAVKNQLEKAPPEKSKLRLPDFFDKIKKQSLTLITDESEKVGNLLRTEIGIALKDNLLCKERRKESFLHCCVRYLGEQSFSALPNDMEAAVESNKKFLIDLSITWQPLLLTLKKNTLNYETHLNQYSLVSADIESYSISLKNFLKNPMATNFENQFIKLFEPYFSNINNPFDKFIRQYKLFCSAWQRIIETDAIEEVRLQCKTAFEVWSNKIELKLLEKNKIDNQSLILGCLSFLKEMNFDSNGNTTNKINLEGAYVTASSIFAYQFVSKSWDDIYSRYCLGVEKTDVQLSADELGILANHWQINLTILFNDGNTYQTPPINDSVLLNIVLCNPRKNHWQVVNTNSLDQPSINDIQLQMTAQLTKSKSAISFNELFKSVKPDGPDAVGEEYNKYPKLADALKGPIYQQLYAANLLFSRFSLAIAPEDKDFDIKVEDVDSGVGFDDIKFFHKKDGNITHTYSYQIKHGKDETDNIYRRGVFDTKTGYNKEVMLYKYFDAWIQHYRNKPNTYIYIATNHKLDPEDKTLQQCFSENEKSKITSFVDCFKTGKNFPTDEVENYYKEFIHSIKLYAEYFANEREVPTPKKTSTPTKDQTPTKSKAPKPKLKSNFNHVIANNLMHEFFNTLKFKFNSPGKNALEKSLKEKICKHFNIENDAIYYALFHEMLFWLTDKNNSHNLQTTTQFFDVTYKKNISLLKLLGISQQKLRDCYDLVPTPKVNLNHRLISLQENILDLLNNKHIHLMLINGEPGTAKSSILSEYFLGEYGKQFRQGRYICLDERTLVNKEYLAVIQLDLIKIVIIDLFDFEIHSQIVEQLHHLRKKTILISHDDINKKFEDKKIPHILYTMSILNTAELGNYIKSNALSQSSFVFAGSQYTITDVLKYPKWAISEHIKNLANLRTITFKPNNPPPTPNEPYISPLIEKALPTYELSEFIINCDQVAILHIDNKFSDKAIHYLKEKLSKIEDPRIKNNPVFEILTLNSIAFNRFKELEPNATTDQALKMINQNIRVGNVYYFIKITEIRLDEKFLNFLNILLRGKDIVIFMSPAIIDNNRVLNAAIIEHIPTNDSTIECKIIRAHGNKDLVLQGNCFEQYSYEHLMTELENNSTYKILLTANGGQGKTTLLQKIINDRLAGRTTRFSWIILIKLGLVARYKLNNGISNDIDLLLFIIEKQLYINGLILSEEEKAILRRLRRGARYDFRPSLTPKIHSPLTTIILMPHPSCSRMLLHRELAQHPRSND